MWRSLLNVLVLTVLSVHMADMQDLGGFTQLVKAGDDKIGNLTPTTSTISLADLSLMANLLKPLEKNSRTKRQVNPQGPNPEQKKELDEVAKSIKIPLGNKGTSAFSVHANTVYILYPSLFQDPNIFGRLSIPQNVNLAKTQQGPNGQPPPQTGGSKGKRSADAEPATTTAAPAPPAPAAAVPEKKDIHTTLTGTIVVQNQDVNEFNRRESY